MKAIGCMVATQGARKKQESGDRKRGARFEEKGQRDCDSMTLRRKDAKTNKMQVPEYNQNKEKGKNPRHTTDHGLPSTDNG